MHAWPLPVLARRALLVAAALALASPATILAQVFKCVDASGHTTYQQTPCPASAHGGRIDLSIDNGNTRATEEDEAIWQSAAREKTVIVGMPARYVRVALGAPREMRPGRADENAAEIWSYPKPDSIVLRLGFRNGAVTWMRNDSQDAAAEGPVADDEATQRVLRRRNVLEGQPCDNLADTLGAPDRTEQAGAADGGAAARYTWEPAPGDPYVRTIVSCTAGRVSYVERLNAR